MSIRAVRIEVLQARRAHHVERLRIHLASRGRARDYDHATVARREISSIRIIDSRLAHLRGLR